MLAHRFEKTQGRCGNFGTDFTVSPFLCQSVFSLRERIFQWTTNNLSRPRLQRYLDAVQDKEKALLLYTYNIQII